MGSVCTFVIFSLDPSLGVCRLLTDVSVNCSSVFGFWGPGSFRAPSSLSFVGVALRRVRSSFELTSVRDLCLVFMGACSRCVWSFCPELAMKRVPGGFLPPLRRVALQVVYGSRYPWSPKPRPRMDDATVVAEVLVPAVASALPEGALSMWVLPGIRDAPVLLLLRRVHLVALCLIILWHLRGWTSQPV